MLDEADERLLTNDQQRELKEYEHMFGSNAWMRIAQEARTKAAILRAQAINANSYESLAQVRGRIEILEYFADLDKAIMGQYQGYADDAVQAREEAVESQGSNS